MIAIRSLAPADALGSRKVVGSDASSPRQQARANQYPPRNKPIPRYGSHPQYGRPDKFLSNRPRGWTSVFVYSGPLQRMQWPWSDVGAGKLRIDASPLLPSTNAATQSCNHKHLAMDRGDIIASPKAPPSSGIELPRRKLQHPKVRAAANRPLPASRTPCHPHPSTLFASHLRFHLVIGRWARSHSRSPEARRTRMVGTRPGSAASWSTYKAELGG
jgi:hypothetical protein